MNDGTFTLKASQHRGRCRTPLVYGTFRSDIETFLQFHSRQDKAKFNPITPA